MQQVSLEVSCIREFDLALDPARGCLGVIIPQGPRDDSRAILSLYKGLAQACVIYRRTYYSALNKGL